jgi:hypothetical protein
VKEYGWEVCDRKKNLKQRKPSRVEIAETMYNMERRTSS